MLGLVIYYQRKLGTIVRVEGAHVPVLFFFLSSVLFFFFLFSSFLFFLLPSSLLSVGPVPTLDARERA